MPHEEAVPPSSMTVLCMGSKDWIRSLTISSKERSLELFAAGMAISLPDGIFCRLPTHRFRMILSVVSRHSRDILSGVTALFALHL